jgi:hypothetical protein
LAFLFNVLVSSVVISVAAWLSRRFPVAAGFLVALPLASMLVLPLSYFEHGSQQTTIDLARSIFIAIPVSLAFFIPFLLAERLSLSFWQAYALGCAVLPLGFLVHRVVARLIV